MPILNVKLAAEPSPDLVRAASELLLDLTTKILRKQRELTAIAFEFVDPRHWVVGGATLQSQGRSSVFLEIKVTDETNTKDEKAAYIAAVFGGFETLLGKLHEESYVHIHDVRADAYGYGGRTQEFRYIHAALNKS